MLLHRYLLHITLMVVAAVGNATTPKPFGWQQLPATVWAEQPNYPTDYFGSPLEIPLVLSGTFGELRSNHFHSGIDIKTQGVVGKNVLAAADGYVSRVKISPWGYGKAVYITHPNGYTTVYAHLDEIIGELGNYIKKQQQLQESFAVDLFPGKNRFEFVKGQVFAKSGNSGGSGGPHLHFEIRETATERPINPLHFEFAIRDDLPPIIQGVQIHPLSETADVNGLTQPFSAQLDVKGKGSYTLRNPITAAGEIGFSINTFDRQNGATNQNGVYSVVLFVNNEKLYDFKADILDFNETRYLNALIDFDRFFRLKNRYHKTYIEPGNRLQMFPYKHPNKGVLAVLPDSSYAIKIVVADIEGNTSEVTFAVQGSAVSRQPENNQEDSLIRFNQSFHFQTDSIRIHLPANVLYRNTRFQYNTKPGNSKTLSDIHEILDGGVPAHKYYSVKIRGNALAKKHRDKACIVSFSKSNELVYEGKNWEGDWLTASTRSFGAYAIAIDTLPPIISPITISGNHSVHKPTSILVKISDGLSGINTYRGTINGNWIVMDYDPKTQRLEYLIDETTKSGENTFRLVVTDNVGNVSQFEARFSR